MLSCTNRQRQSVVRLLLERGLRVNSSALPLSSPSTNWITAIEANTQQRSPTISPALISNTRRHQSDPNKRRATFQVPYPIHEIVLERRSDLADKLPPRFENGRQFVSPLP